jgi:hypothetical protein
MMPEALRCAKAVARDLRCIVDQGAVHHRRTIRKSIPSTERIEHASQVLQRYSALPVEAVLNAEFSRYSANPCSALVRITADLVHWPAMESLQTDSAARKVTVLLDEQLSRRLAEYCAAEGFKKSTLFVKLLRAHLEAARRQPRGRRGRQSPRQQATA